MITIESKDFGETKPVVVAKTDDDYSDKYIKQQFKEEEW